MARILLLGGGCRGLELARALRGDGHAVRITSRREQSREAIQALGAEAWIGDPARLASLRGVLDGVAIACWLLARATGSEEQLRALQSERLQFFLTQAIDSTVRGFVYEAGADARGKAGRGAGAGRDGGDGDGMGASSGGFPNAAALAAGEQVARRLAERNVIPLEVLRADPGERHGWLLAAKAAIGRLLDRP